MKPIRFLITAFSLLLISCKEYVPYISCKVNGVPYRVETDIAAQYISNGSMSQCFIQANGTQWDIIIRTQANVQGNYAFGYGSSPQALVEFYDGSLFTSNYLGTSGNVELIQVGSSLVEGYFSGTLKSDNIILTISDGEFTSRAY